MTELVLSQLTDLFNFLTLSVFHGTVKERKKGTDINLPCDGKGLTPAFKKIIIRC